MQPVLLLLSQNFCNQPLMRFISFASNIGPAAAVPAGPAPSPLIGHACSKLKLLMCRCYHRKVGHHVLASCETVRHMKYWHTQRNTYVHVPIIHSEKVGFLGRARCGCLPHPVQDARPHQWLEGGGEGYLPCCKSERSCFDCIE